MDLLIVEPLGAEVLGWLESRRSVRCIPAFASDPAGLRQALVEVRAMILPPELAIDADLLRCAPRLRAIGRVSAGAENIDLQACQRAGVEVVRSPQSTDAAEAEFMIGALLSMLRRVPVVDADGLRVGRELGAATVGLLGLPVGTRALTRRLAAFGCPVIGYDPARHASDPVFERLAVRPVGLRELFEQADAICVQLGYFTRYRGLVGERLLDAARRDQVIVCTTHSAVFDEAALAEALQAGRLAAVWLDSVEPVTRERGRPLRGLGALQVTPRIARTTRESRLRSAWAVARRIDALLGSAVGN